MSVNSYLNDVASQLIVKGEEKDSIKKSIAVFSDRMEDYYSSHESVGLNEIKIYGSYHRDTNLPRKADGKSDVDIMLVMEDDGSTPQTYLNRVRRAVEAKYSTSEIMQSSPTIVLQMNHIKFEIMPAIKDGIYYIKNENNNWMPTYCATDLSNLSDANQANNNCIKPLIRLVKYWNASLNYKALHSYEIEKSIVSYYLSKQYQGYDTKNYLLSGLKQLRYMTMSEFSRERLDTAIDSVRWVINNEKNYPSLSLHEIKHVIKEL